MTVRKIFAIVLFLAICLLPIRDSIAAPIIEVNKDQIDPPQNEVSTGIAPKQDVSTPDITSLSGSNVIFYPAAGGDTCYSPGTPQTFCFQSETFTSDYEYVYNNWFRFPSNWVVSNVYVQGTPVCDSGTWGTFGWSFHTPSYEVNINHGRYQDTVDHCLATYCVNLTPAGTADPAQMSWYFSGDGYANAPHNPCSNNGYSPSGQNACDQAVAPLAAIPACAVTSEVILTPPEIETSGCHGRSQAHTLTVANFTGADANLDITYELNFPGNLFGPSIITLANGATTTFDIFLDPHVCAEDGDYIGTVTVSDGTYSDQSTIYFEVFSELKEWRQIPDNPVFLMDNVLAAYDGKVWSINGQGSSSTVSYYDPSLDAWTTVSGSAPPWGGAGYPRSGCQVDNEVFVYGDSTTAGFSGLWSYNMDTNLWTAEAPTGTPPPSTGIWSPSWVADTFTGRCYMTGGATAPGGGNLSTVYVYNTITNEWLPELPTFTTARDFHAAFLFTRPADTHKLLCVAGGVNGSSVVFDSTQCFDFSTSTWNTENNDLGSLPAGWWGMGYTQREGKLWLVEGADSAFALYNQSAYYDVGAGEWVNVGPLPSGTVYRTAAVTLDDTVYHVGGSAGSFTPSGLSDKYLDFTCATCVVPALTKQATAVAFPGQNIHYSLTVEPFVSDTAFVVDYLPDSVDYVPGSLSVSPDVGFYNYESPSRLIWWYYTPGLTGTQEWNPAEKVGGSVSTPLSTHSEEPAVLTQTESVENEINSVLWDQPLSSVNQNAYVSQEFSDLPAYSSYLADDFEATSLWSIDTIFVPGHGWNGFTSLMNATWLTFMIYEDNGGEPAGDPSGGGIPPLWFYTTAPTDPQITITTGSGGLPSNTLFTLDVPIILPAGHYWLIFYPTLALTSGGQFGRQPADTMNSHSALVINPGGGFGFETDWQSWMDWWGFDSDMAFRIEGTEIPTLQIEFDATAHALSQTIWNFASLEYGSYVISANDDTFTGYGTYLPMLLK